jgi:cysteine desulfurase / selenocysteine lyase
MTSAQNETRTNAGFDVEAVRREFPILHQEVHGKPLVYLDSAATTQKPQCVIDAVRGYYEHDNANVHRGMHELSNRATAQYENARRLVQRHIGAGDAREIIFTRGTTESINLIAQSWGRLRLSAGDEVLVSQMEHHSNIVPWQLLRDQIGITIKPIPVTDTGELDLDSYEKLLSDKTKLVAVGHVSNVLGTINPIKHMAKLAHDAGAAIVVDGAQAMPHMRVDVRELDVDFYAISGHKMYGPTGIGALFGKLEHLTAMPPYQGGGEMIKAVTFDKTIFNDPPHKFEAGTPNIAGTIGFAAATEFLQRIGLDSVAAHEHDVLQYGMEQLAQVPGLKLIGTAREKTGAMSFIIDGMHPYDVAPILDHEGIAVRDGHHCAQPLMERFGVTATLRASLGMYSTQAEIDALIRALAKAREMLA